jgi:FG-GAP-like repeat
MGAGNVSILLGDGTGVNFARQADAAVGSLPFWLTIGDFNGDGKPDLVTANGSGSISVLLQ